MKILISVLIVFVLASVFKYLSFYGLNKFKYNQKAKKYMLHQNYRYLSERGFKET